MSEAIQQAIRAMEWMLCDYEHLNTMGEPLAANWPQRVQAVKDAVAKLQAAQAQAGEGGAVYAYRRKGLDYFCTCDESRYLELSEKRNFEVAIFYTRPPAQQKFDESTARWRHDSEELEALHMNLDDAKAPRDEGGKCLSAWGRVVRYAQINQQLLEALEYYAEYFDGSVGNKARAAIAAAQEQGK
jgi:hypothetical protein